VQKKKKIAFLGYLATFNIEKKIAWDFKPIPKWSLLPFKSPHDLLP
jgi:hypothetical protein